MLTNTYTVRPANASEYGTRCILKAPAGIAQCTEDAHYVVNVYDFSDDEPQHIRTIKACDDHADLYR